jgi:6-phosphogluconolactonase (cycloisomerase 2 family)
MLRSIGSMTFLALLLVGCGGSSSSQPPPPASYTIGGTVSGLSGSGLVLQNSGGADLPISASGTFTFPTPVPSGTSYAVTVKNSPSSPAQGCLIANGTGTVTSANITNVSVSCQDGFTVSGTVTGLAGSGLVLQTCFPGGAGHGGAGPACTQNSPVSADGAFSFNAVFPSEDHVFVFIAQQPTSPAQHCVINNARVPASTGTGFTVACTGYAYVTNSADNTLSAYSVDPTTGALKSLGSPVATGSSPFATVGVEFNDNIITSDDFRYVYVVNQGSNDVSGFAVDSSTGALSVITSSAFPGPPWAVGTAPQAMAAFVPAQALYIANTGSDDLTVFGIDPGSGALNAPSTYPTGKGPTSLAIVAGPGLLYIANHGGSNDISGYLLNDMTPLPGSPFPAGGNPLSLAIGAEGKFLYSANPGHARSTPSTLSGFSIDPSTGTLSPLSGSPFAMPVTSYIATDQTGAYLYITSGDVIVGYAINQNTGALTALAGFPVATNVPSDAYSISIDSTNQFLYVANELGATVSGFRLDAATGGLTPMAAPFPAGNGPQFVATF